MIHPFRIARSEDDSAPRDYSYVSSVNQGLRIQQSQNIRGKESPSEPIVRHRAEPYDRAAVDAYGTRERRRTEPPRTPYRGVMNRLPSMADGMPEAQSIAYPEDYGIPDNPFDQPVEPPQPVRRARPRAERPVQEAPVQPETSQPPVTTTENGSQFEPPAAPEIPDWLRVAQQNNLPLRRPEGPRVQAARRQAAQEENVPVPTDLLGRPLRSRAATAAAMRAPNAAPQTLDEYADAGYPEELLNQQRRMEAEAAAVPVRRRHGAQYAVKQDWPEQEEAPSRQVRRGSYPPPREPESNRRAVFASSNAPFQQSVQTGAPLTEYASWQGRAAAYQQNAPQQAPMHMARGYAPAEQEAPDDGWQVETDPEEKSRVRIPWLGMAAVAAVLAAVGLFTAGVVFTKQTEAVLTARAAEQAAIAENNPYSYRELVEQKAGKYNLSPAFVAAIIRNESSFRPDATSSVGARGLMQLMDDTAQWIHGKMELDTAYDFDALYDPETNVEFGCWYLRFLSDRFYGDPVLVAAAFHAGQNQVQNWLNDSTYSADHLTLEIENMVDGPTKQYVTRVTRSFAIYKRLYYEATEEMG